MANFFDIQVPYSARRAELRHALSEKLVEKGVLPKSAMAETVREAEVNVSMANVKAAEVAGMLASGMEPDPTSETRGSLSTEDLRLALKMKEVENRNKELELQTMHRCIRALELEKGTPVTSTPVSASAASLSAGFDIRRHIAVVPPFCEAKVDSHLRTF